MMSTIIKMGQAKHVALPFKKEAIKASVRKGNDLEITLDGGQVVVLEDFYLEPRTLLTNGTQGNVVEQLTLSPEGAVVGSQQLSAAELDTLLGGKASNLSSQVTDVILFKGGEAGAESIPYLNEALIGGAALIGALGAIAWNEDENNGGSSSSPKDTTDPTQPTGVAVVANGAGVSGTGEAGTTVTVTDANGQVLGTATVPANGKFYVTLDPALTNGEEVSVTLTDKAGNESGEVTINANDTTAPAAASNVDVSDDGLKVTGTGEPGAVATVKDAKGNILGTATIPESGIFTVALTPALTNGETVSVSVSDAKNNTSPTTTATAPDTTDPDAATNVAISTDGTKVTGKGEPGATAVVTVNGKEYTAPVAKDGSFTVAITPALTNGEELAVTVKDATGNESSPVTINATDSTAPAAPTGVAINDEGTTVTGNGEAGATVSVLVEGKEVAKATVNKDGSFTINLDSPLTNGETLSVVVTDPAGNASAATTEVAAIASEEGEAILDKGNARYHYYDDNGDGIIDRAEVVTYDKAPSLSDAKPVRKQIFNEASDIGGGTAKLADVTGRSDVTTPIAPTDADSIEFSIYNADGQETRHLYNTDAQNKTGQYVNGKNGIDKYEDYTYDANGNKIVISYNNDASKTGQTGTGYDAITYINYQEATIDGETVYLEAEKFFDMNADGVIDQVIRYSYDDKGNVIEEHTDNDPGSLAVKNADGTYTYTGEMGDIDKIVFFEYSDTLVDVETGKPVLLRKLTNTDGKVTTGNDATNATTGEVYNGIDTIETYTPNQDGQIVKVNYDNNGDGKADKIQYLTLDKYGNVLKEFWDADAKETTYGSGTYTWVDENGVTQTLKGIDQVKEHDLNAKGEIVATRYDNNADTTVDAADYFVRDANGNIEVKYVNADYKDTGKTKTINGIEVRGIDKVETYELNAKGQTTETRYDNNADGTDDQRQIYTLNSAGYTIQTETDVTNDGTIDKVSTYTLNEKGNILQKLDYNRSYDTQGVATDTLAQKEVYSVNNYGSTIGMTRYVAENSVASVAETYTVNALGQRTRAEIDNYSDSITDRIENYVLDVYGRIERLEILDGQGENITGVITYERNALGLVTVQKSLDVASGTTTVLENTYDEYGNIILRKTYNSSDMTTPSQIGQWEYNELGQQVVSLRTNADGSQQKWIRTYNELNRVVYEETDRGNDGTIDSAYYNLAWDERGNLTKSHTDSNVNGKFDSGDVMIAYTYGDVFNTALEQHQYSDEAMTVLRRQYVYTLNGYGNNISYLYDWNGDGKFEQFGFGGGISPASHQEDITKWEQAQFEKLASLREFNMTTNTVSTLILNKEVLSKFTSDKFYIFNGAAKDTVKLLNGAQDFTKTQDDTASGNRTYDVYSTSDGKELWIQDGITVDLDNTSVI